VKQRKRGDTKQHRADVILQEICRALGRAYNSFEPPKRVQYIPLYLIQYRGLDLTVEPFLKGRFLKHNNNRGFVPPYPRSTPQAFSHFTYHHTKGALCVVDVQGVGDSYTDPQIHTSTGKGFGLGNLGEAGMERFLDTHRCNKICAYLQLPPVRHGPVYNLPTTPAPKHDCPVGVAFSLADYVPDVLDTTEAPTAETLAVLGVSLKLLERGIAAWKSDHPQSGRMLPKPNVLRISQRFREPGHKEWMHRHEHLLGPEVHVADFLWWLGRLEQTGLSH